MIILMLNPFFKPKLNEAKFFSILLPPCASLASSSVNPPLAAEVMGACFLEGMGPPV